MTKKLTKLSFIFILMFFFTEGIVMSQTSTYTCTYDVQTYTVPAGVTYISIEAWGAQGGSGGPSTAGIGGEGGYAYGELSVTPGQVLNIYVGGEGESYVMQGTGGYNGGGGTNATSDDNRRPGCGGGASDVRVGGTAFADRVIVAAGGGGASGWTDGNGGAGGGLIGEDGQPPFYNAVESLGGGGTQDAGGVAGYIGTNYAEPGELGLGGYGKGFSHGGGGGGAGYYGGGGGTVSAGGAGSSYIDGVQNGTTTTGGRAGAGLITIVVLNPSVTTQPTDITDICVGDEAIFFVIADNVDTYTWTVSDDGGSSWTIITDDATYSGAATYSLTVTTDINLEGYQYSCILTNTYTNTITDAATLTFETEVPTITCIGDQEVDADADHVYIVVGDEFDPTDTDDNCEVESVINDFNNAATLDGEELPEGTTTITWTVTDTGGNEADCSFDVLVNAYVGINESAKTGISVYPNPSNGIFTIENAEGYDISICDLTGKQVYFSKINERLSILDLKSILESGIYIINLKSDTKNFTKKLILE